MKVMEEVIKTQDSYSETKFTETETEEIKEKSELEEKNSNTTDDILSSDNKNDKDTDINKIARNNKVLKRKLTEDGVAIERVLSEGETSSGFETVSSVDSNVNIDDIDDLDLSSLNELDDEYKDKFNVIVQFENELAYKNEKEKRILYWDEYSSVIHNHRKDYSMSEHDRRRLHTSSSREKKYYNSEKNYNKCEKRDKFSSERESGDHFRRTASHDKDRNTHGWNRKSRRNDSRSRRSRSSERNHRYRSSRSSERSGRCRSSGNKDRKTESRHSGSSDKYSSNPRRNSASKRRSRFSRSPCSVWSRLDSRISPIRSKKEGNSKNKRDSSARSSWKKERTPFLVELERKLKEADQTKTVNANDTMQMPHPPQNPPLPPPTFPPISAIPGVYPLQYQSLPSLSVDNLPLVPGPTGLPVHITVTGEQIPHDMDGKRIPVGPNGYYLPLDPTGRLFPHIVSPANQAIPVHMTDDGVLRLPNSEPVPFGPCHQLPVNIDGRVIFIGPDSKPLYPYPNLPRGPPINLLAMVNSFGVENTGMLQTVPQVPPIPPQIENQQRVEIQPQQSACHFNFPSEINFTSPNFTQNPPEENRKQDPLENYKKPDGEKTENHPQNNEMEEKSDANSFKRGVKRTLPLKLWQKRAFKEDNSHHRNRGCDTISSSGGLAPGGTPATDKSKDAGEETVLTSEEEQCFLEIVCGNKSFTIPTTNLKSEDPIAKKTQQAINSLSEKNYKPPVFGRFIISDIYSSVDITKKCPNESPLLRNRLKLPYITPNAKEFYSLKQPVSVERSRVTFKFLPQKSEKGEKPCKYSKLCSSSTKKFPVFTFDFAMQCDFTSVIIKNLNSKITELEMEVVRLRKVNANLLDDCKNAQASNEKKSDELRKAMLEIQERNSEIQALKNSMETHQ